MLKKMPADKQVEILRAYFDPGKEVYHVWETLDHFAEIKLPAGTYEGGDREIGGAEFGDVHVYEEALKESLQNYKGGYATTRIGGGFLFLRFAPSPDNNLRYLQESLVRLCPSGTIRK